MSDLTRKIKTAGYIEVSIRPGRFVADRVQPITSLFPIVQRCKVSLRGWDYPHIDRKQPDPVPNRDFVEQESNSDHHLESWRLYQSGQFLSLRGISYDWRDQSSVWPADKNWRRRDLLIVEQTLFTLAEIFEFAARLSNTAAGDDPMYVDIIFGGLEGRALAVSDFRRIDSVAGTRAQIQEYPQKFVVPSAELVAEPRSRAIRASQELFRRFGEELRPDLLRDWLDELIRR